MRKFLEVSKFCLRLINFLPFDIEKLNCNIRFYDTDFCDSMTYLGDFMYRNDFARILFLFITKENVLMFRLMSQKI